VKRKILLVAAVLVLSLVSVLGCTSQGKDVTGVSIPSGSVLALSSNSQTTGIWVTGEGKVTAIPDLLIMTLGVESQEPTVAEAQAKAVEAMDAIKKILLEQGIAEKDIQTQYFNISRVTRWLQDEYKEEVIGYRVANTVTVKVRQLDTAGTIIDVVTEAAGDLIRIDGISFTVEDPTSYYNQAREKAMQDAVAKATQVAGLAGVALDKATYINVSGNNYPIRTTMDSYQVYEKSSGAGMPAPTPATSISVGELEIQTTVTIVFGIK